MKRQLSPSRRRPRAARATATARAAATAVVPDLGTGLNADDVHVLQVLLHLYDTLVCMHHAAGTSASSNLPNELGAVKESVRRDRVTGYSAYYTMPAAPR